MTVLKHVTGLVAIFLVTVFPIMIRSGDICEESADRAEAYVSSFVDEAAAQRMINGMCIDKLSALLAREPDVYDFYVTVGIRHLVPRGGSYYVNMEHEQIMSLIERGETISLEEGDTVTVCATVSSPSQFSRITGMYENERERDNRKITVGRRIGRDGR